MATETSATRLPRALSGGWTHLLLPKVGPPIPKQGKLAFPKALVKRRQQLEDPIQQLAYHEACKEVQLLRPKKGKLAFPRTVLKHGSTKCTAMRNSVFNVTLNSLIYPLPP